MKTFLKIVGGFFLAIFVLGFIANLVNGDKTETNHSSDQAAIAEKPKKQVTKEEYQSSLESTLASLKNYKPTARKEAMDITIELGILYAYATMADSAKSNADSKISQLGKQIEKQLSKVQAVELSKLRKAYQKIMYKAFWENDIDVAITGATSSTLQITGAVFAANKNIKDFHQQLIDEKIHETLSALRFKKVEYRWYKGQDEYTYFTVESPVDSRVVLVSQLP